MGTDRILERGEKIELLVDKTEQLNQQAFKFVKKVNWLIQSLKILWQINDVHFQMQTKSFRQKLYCNSWKLNIIIFLSFLVISKKIKYYCVTYLFLFD